jgi:hypothetical protein
MRASLLNLPTSLAYSPYFLPLLTLPALLILKHSHLRQF